MDVHLSFLIPVFSLQLLPLWHYDVKGNLMCN